MSIINTLDFAGDTQSLTHILHVHMSVCVYIYMYLFKNVEAMRHSQRHTKTGQEPNLTHA